MVNGVNYHYLDQGQGSPLVLLHGFTGSSASWEEFNNLITGHCRTIAIDLPGHGRTISPNQPQRYSIQAVSNDIVALLDTLKIGYSDLLGYSMGGRLALYLALDKPTQFRSLILESASPGLDSIDLRHKRVQKDGLLANRIEANGVPAFVERWQRLPLFESQNNLARERQEGQRRQRLNNTAVGLANSLRGMGTGQQPSLWSELLSLLVPTLLIAGSLDLKYSDINRQMAQIMPDSKLKIISGAGHNVHLEMPEQFAKTVLAFLDSQQQLAQTKKEHEQERYQR